MKSKIAILSSVLFFIFFLQSCQIEKRHYMSGYNFHWNQTQKNYMKSNFVKVKEKTIDNKMNVCNNKEIYDSLEYFDFNEQLVFDNNKILDQISESYSSIANDNFMTTDAIKLMQNYQQLFFCSNDKRFSLSKFHINLLDLNRPMLFDFSSQNANNVCLSKETISRLLNRRYEQKSNEDIKILLLALGYISLCAALFLLLFEISVDTIILVGAIGLLFLIVRACIPDFSEGPPTPPRSPGLYGLTAWNYTSTDRDCNAREIEINGEVGHRLTVHNPTADCVPDGNFSGKFVVTSGELPNGLAMDYQGKIDGFPEKRGHWIVNIKGTLNCGNKTYILSQQLIFDIKGSGEVIH